MITLLMAFEECIFFNSKLLFEFVFSTRFGLLLSDYFETEV